MTGSWMTIQDVKWPDVQGSLIDDVVVTGVVRGKGLKADRIVHIPGWGDFSDWGIYNSGTTAEYEREKGGFD